MRALRVHRGGAALIALSAVWILAGLLPAHADRWFGSITVSCESFGLCALFPAMPQPPADSASIEIDRAGKANAPIEILVRVNKPVEGGAPIRLELGAAVFDLQPGLDVETRRSADGKRATGYWITQARVGALLAAMRRVDTGRLIIAIAGQSEPQNRLIQLDGLDAALRHLDEWQGRAGAQDAVIDKGTREPVDMPVPKPLPAKADWPVAIQRIFKREKCEDRLATFEELTTGAIVARGDRALWQIPCAGGNYNILFTFVELRGGEPRTARLVTFPSRRSRRPDGVLTNPVWQVSRHEVWAFERYRAHGDCGLVARYHWGPHGFVLLDQRRKEDCDGRFTDPWTTWPIVKPRPGSRRR
jgi:hypothetical protein